MPATLREVFGTDGLLDGYAAFLGSFVAVLIVVYAVFAMQTLCAEASRGRVDAILATPLGRTIWLRSQTAVVAGGAALICLTTGLGTGIAAAGITGNRALVGNVLAAHVGFLPAVLLVIAICAALYGGSPRLLAPLAWALVALTTNLLRRPARSARLAHLAVAVQPPRPTPGRRVRGHPIPGDHRPRCSHDNRGAGGLPTTPDQHRVTVYCDTAPTRVDSIKVTSNTIATIRGGHPSNVTYVSSKAEAASTPNGGLPFTCG